MTIWTVEAVLTGRVQPLRRDELSGIRKETKSGQVAVDVLGLAGDEQADLRVHGGPDKAIHHYPHDHYPFWESLNFTHSKLEQVGAFGENISTSGLVESEACIGDRYRLGSAVVEIAQGRQPCWKQGHVMDWPQLVALMVKHRRTGWYYRVIETGTVAAGDRLELIERPFVDWTVERVFGLLIAGDAKDDPAAARALAALPVLAESWRIKAEKLGTG